MNQIASDPNAFERDYVQNVYSQISNHFSNTRNHSWPKIVKFINNLNKNTIVYDIGCGNGRNMGLRHDCRYIGCDKNSNLLKEAKRKGHNCILADNLDLPFKTNVSDAIISIAVIHHFCTTERRILALKELFRILKPGGKILIYVWSYEQEKFKTKEKNALLTWKNQKDNKELLRYYYLFSKLELDTLITDNFKEIQILESGNQCNNWYVVCTKNY
jgi:tRNA (uracil-5-)-methyltransferase TRM9